MPSNKELLSLVADIAKELDESVEVSGASGQVEFLSARNSLLEKIKSLKTAGGGSDALHASPLNQWTEQTEHRDAPEGVEDPNSAVVQHLLSSWSSKAENVAYITNWLISLKETKESKSTLSRSGGGD